MRNQSFTDAITKAGFGYLTIYKALGGSKRFHRKNMKNSWIAPPSGALARAGNGYPRVPLPSTLLPQYAKTACRGPRPLGLSSAFPPGTDRVDLIQFAEGNFPGGVP
jgi:hypothetical protein